MDFSEPDYSNAPDDGHNADIDRLSVWQGAGGKLRLPSEDSHERYHSRHIEFMERATATISDDDFDWDHSPVGRRDRPVNTARLTQMVLDMQQKLASLERQLGSGVDLADQASAVMQPPTIKLQLNQAASLAHETVTSEAKLVEMLPELHEAPWSDFMNKFADDEQEYAIEILTGPSGDHRRSKHKQVPDEDEQPEDRVSDDVAHATEPAMTPIEESHFIPDRIRINSPQILATLASIDKSIDPSVPNVMLRPYKFLVHYESDIRHYTSRLSDEAPVVPSATDEFVEVSHRVKHPPVPQDHAERALLLQHMQCLVAFIDRYIKPRLERLRSYDVGRKIKFKDLWYLFQPGDDIFMPVKDRQRKVSLDPMTITPEMFQGRYERMWRVIGVGGGRRDLSLAKDRDARTRENAFRVTCYYIDFDGVYFCPIVHSFAIQPFVGEKRITSLDFFPYRFLKEGDELRAKSLAQGKLVFNALLQSHTHFYYCGPTLVTQPCGCPLQNDTLHQEHVESEVIIDYRAALLKNPIWRPQPSFWKKPPSRPGEVQDQSRIHHWEDRAQPKLVRTEVDHVYDDNIIDRERALILKDQERIFDPIPSGWLSNEKSVPEQDVAMLSPRVFAFVLRTRTFAPLWLWGLQKISAQTDGLQNLQLRDNSFKNTIHALVRTHFLQKNVQRNSELEYDLVRGKGKGLVFLLHGAPGVGKTFTAESVAAANGRPLFQITCGDLGLTPTDVERALKEIFRFAQLWNCVLLLDECDIFLTQRTKVDLKRNSLVSVFLRVLEWYSGVLFLTTNRVGSLDSAVKSRITWSTYYPPLDLNQTKEIWKVNLNLLEKRNPNIEVDRKGILKFAKEHFSSSIEQGSNWNGRQIQNAFKVALSLADWETLSSEEQHSMDTGITTKDQASRRLKVTADHFHTVAVAAETFDDYLHEATGMTEAQRAFNAQERADDYVNEDEPQENGGNATMPEPPAKKRRKSSTTSAIYQQTRVMTSNHGPASTNAGRRSSNMQVPPQPRSRRSSHHQVKSPAGPLTAAAMAAVKTPPSVAAAAGKRKRAGSDFRRSLDSLPVIHGATEGSSGESSSDFAADDLVGVELPDNDDDWE